MLHQGWHACTSRHTEHGGGRAALPSSRHNALAAPVEAQNAKAIAVFKHEVHDNCMAGLLALS